MLSNGNSANISQGAGPDTEPFWCKYLSGVQSDGSLA